VEAVALQWLQSRHEQRELAAGNALVGLGEPEAVARATATDPESLSQEQAAVAQWLARRYRVAPEPVAALVHEAWASGQRAGLEPTLILAVIAIESSFNPFAQSPVGAQGLMQVMTHVHDDKYGPFGGTHAAFDPITNLRVGVQVLKECIARTGSVAEGLRHYVGAALLETDGGYASRVLAEQAHLRAVAQGKRVPVNVPNTAPAPEKVAGLYLGGPAPAR
jgi:soluble lytic murein transglycosylase-like protein